MLLAGRTQHRHFDGSNSMPYKLPENARAVPKEGSPTTLVPVHFPGCIIPAIARDAALSGLWSGLLYFL
jgi:hypothetical protein